MLITKVEVLHLALPDQNLDQALLMEEVMDQCHRMYLRTQVGEVMYDAILAAPTTVDNQALMPFIKRMLAWFIILESLPHIFVHISSMGVNQNLPDGTQVTTNAQYASIRDKYQRAAEFERNELKRYIKANLATYPDYKPESDKRHPTSKPILY